MTEKPGKGIITDEDIDIQTKSLTIPISLLGR